MLWTSESCHGCDRYIGNRRPRRHFRTCIIRHIYIISVYDTTTSCRHYWRDAHVVVNRDRDVWVGTIRRVRHNYRGWPSFIIFFFFTRFIAPSGGVQVRRFTPECFIKPSAIIPEDFRSDSVKNSSLSLSLGTLPPPPPPSSNSARFESDYFEYLNPLLTTYAASHVACEPFGARIV